MQLVDKIYFTNKHTCSSYIRLFSPSKKNVHYNKEYHNIARCGLSVRFPILLKCPK